MQQIIQSRDGQEQLAIDRQQRIQELEANFYEIEQRYNLLSKEVIKAEGQIDIIKEMLLQEPIS